MLQIEEDTEFSDEGAAEENVLTSIVSNQSIYIQVEHEEAEGEGSIQIAEDPLEDVESQIQDTELLDIDGDELISEEQTFLKYEEEMVDEEHFTIGAVEEIENESQSSRRTKSFESVQITIPDLYGDRSDDSLPELADFATRKEQLDDTRTDIFEVGHSSDESEEIEEHHEGEWSSEELPIFDDYSYFGMEEGESEQEPMRQDDEKLSMGSGLDVLFQFLLEEKPKPKKEKKVIEQKQEEEEDDEELVGIQDLVDDLIDQAVIHSEYIDPDAAMRAKLDHDKLVKTAKKLIMEYKEENKKRIFLNKKVLEFFKRRRYTQAYEEENVATVGDTLERYRKSLLNLDRVRATDVFLREKLSAKLDAINKTKDEFQAECAEKIDLLNKRLYEVGISTVSVKTGQHMSKTAVTAIINKMNDLRDQISKKRRAFIEAQHKLAILQEQGKKLESIGDGLKISDYEQLRAETQGLEDKLDEREIEMNKLQKRCNDNIHFLAHIREKQFMLNNRISQKEKSLKNLKDEQDFNRNRLNKLKIERDLTRKNYNNWVNKCGLLSKPELLHDYDDTVTKIDEALGRIDALKQTRENIIKEVKITEKKLSKMF